MLVINCSRVIKAGSLNSPSFYIGRFNTPQQKSFKSTLTTTQKSKLIYGITKEVSESYNLDVTLTKKRGLDVLKDPMLNKGTAFSMSERERLGLRGLLPPRVQTMEDQLQRNGLYLQHAKELMTDPDLIKEASDLQLYKDLGALADRNEVLFYRLLMDNFEELAPIIYTPTVGNACLKSHTIYRQARGMYLSIKDKGELSSMIYNWPKENEVKVIVVTDGSRVLGLGDLGANGMPIPVGKLALYVAAGGINPKGVLPIVLDVGTNNEELRNNPLYLGIPEKRVEGKEYYDFLDEFIHSVYARWPRVLLQFEDFKNPHASELLMKYRNRFCCFNDDIQSTGAIALAGILSSLRARNLQFKDLAEERIVCVGAGSAGIGVCETIVAAMVSMGIVKTTEEAYSKFWMLDQYGLLGQGRTENHLVDSQRPYLRPNFKDSMSLKEVVDKVKPTILMGLSGSANVFTEEVIRSMSKSVKQPVIFPLSNPTKHSECTAHDAFLWSEGRAIFASGSPFPDVALNGKLYPTSQVNNAYIFPGLGLGILNCLPKVVPDEFFHEAAMIVAASTSYNSTGRLFPGVTHIREISLDIAVKICETATSMGIASKGLKEGETWRATIEASMWDPFYQQLVATL